MVDVVAPTFTRSRAHAARANALIPGGAHTYAKGEDQYPEGMAPVIASGLGCRVRDIDGNEFVEYGGGLRSTTLGHAHQGVVSAVTQWLGSGGNFVRPHELELAAAERLTGLIPCAEMVKFGLNGSDATTAAIRLARAHTGRDLVVTCREHPFLSTDDWFIGTSAMPAGIPEATRQLTTHLHYNDVESVRRVFAEHPGRIAAVIMEAETVTPPDPAFLAEVREQCDRHGTVFVLDEMITGFRWDLRGAQHVYGIAPDLATFGKAMANGFPLSALVGKRDIMRLGGPAEDRDRVFLLSQTFGAQPWALAAMLAVVNVYEREKTVDQLHRIGADLRAGIEEVVAAAGLSDHLQLAGRDWNLVYVARDENGQPSQEFRTLVLQELMRRGVLAPSFVVSAAHDHAAITQTLDAVAGVAVAYTRALEDGVGSVLEGRPVRPALRPRG